MLLDALLWLWVNGTISIVKVVAPSRAAELESLRTILTKPTAPAAQQESPQQEGPHSKAEMPSETVDNKVKNLDAVSCPMRITSDLIQDDQNPGANSPTSASPSPLHARRVPSSNLEATTPPPASAMEEFRELQMRMEDLKASTPEMRNLLGLLLRSNEDNAVLKSALLTTLSKLQAARDELHFTRAELQVSQEQAHLLLEERESVCFAEADGCDGSDEEHTGVDTEADVIVKRSLDVLLASLEASFLNGEGSAASSSVGWAENAASSPPCSFEPESNQQLQLSLSSSPLVSPRGSFGEAAATHVGKQPTVHLKGVGYRVSFAQANTHDH